MTLFAIAASIALDRTLDRYYEKKNNNKSISADDIIGITNSMVSEARQKGEDTLRKLSDKLNNIQMPFGMSSSVKDFLTTQKSKLSKMNEKATRDISAVEKKLNDVEQRAQNLSNQTADYRKIYGNEKLEGIKDDAKEAIKQMENIRKGVETNV